ncbi:MAG: ABC transporter transmembrane domain-containing protein, partial [Sporomusaceae bacterium]|nr:ABC transporter transmembrane domain-containing protein [Sporomusaceae bacterium]
MKYTKAFHLLQPFYRSKWLPYSFGLLLLIGVDILQLAIPRFIGKSIDTFLTNSGELSVYIMWLTVTALLMFVGRYCYRQLLLGTTRRLEAYLRQRIFLHGLCLPLAYYDQKGPGNIMALMTNDITAIRVALGLGSILFVDAVIMGFASFVVMAKVIHFELSLWSILPLPVILCIATYMGKSVHQRFRRVQESFSDITDFSQEIFAGFKVVKGFAVEKN